MGNQNGRPFKDDDDAEQGSQSSQKSDPRSFSRVNEFGPVTQSFPIPGQMSEYQTSKDLECLDPALVPQAITCTFGIFRERFFFSEQASKQSACVYDVGTRNRID